MSDKTKRYWISWEQLSDDYRPLQDPPQPENIKAWWCSGSTPENTSTLCAIVDAENETDAQAVILTAWEAPGSVEVGRLRFVKEKPDDWLPNDRFPITKGWVKERLGIN